MQVISETVQTKNGAFTLRPASIEDLESVAAVINASGMDQLGRPLTSPKELAEDWNMDSFDLGASTRVAEVPGGRIVGYIEVRDIDPVPVNNWVWARVDPQFEGLGIGTALMTWAVDRLQSAVTRAPDDARVTFQSAANSAHTPSKELFEDLGMTRIRRFWHMMIEFDGPPPNPVWPPNIEISTFVTRDNLRAIVEADNESFQDHWGYVPQPIDHLVNEFQEWTDNQSDFDPSLWFLAMDGDEIAGICLCSRNRVQYPGAGWVNILGVRRPWRKQGLGLALLHHAFGVFYRERKKGVGLGVDSASLTGATRLYEKAGMSVIKEDDAYEKELRPGRALSKK